MKIRTLYLKAFGPFTNTTLDFSGSANLHVIYGPNEAGKSSALRAMADLRYGIHPRSKDDFVHGYKDMLLSGCFVDAAGRAVGLARRKGNKDTLALADSATGEPLSASQVAPDVLLALTGGVGREQFETMYGLDSQHLRSGGQMLIHGEGELGAALFEASTGTSDIKTMLETLQADAKKYFTPRGQSTVLNEAARQLEESKQRYKQAVTKPEQWKTLNRAHEDAKSRLADIRMQLAHKRRRLAELTELRAVEPLLRQLDRTADEWSEVQDHVALAVDSRERRLATQQRQAQAEAALLEADAALAECRQGMQALSIETSLLTHATAIDRLETDQAVVRRERDNRVRLESSAESEAQQLMLQATRLTQTVRPVQTLEELFRQTPSSADRAELERALEQFQSLTQDLHHAKAQLHASRQKLAQYQNEQLDAPASELQQGMTLALTHAQSLGDAEKRLTALTSGFGTEQRKLVRAMADLGFTTEEELTDSRWLASSEIDAYDREHTELLKRLELNADQVQQIEGDLANQKRRRMSLAAAGEVVSAETLKQARMVREEGWQGIRKIFIDKPSGTNGEKASVPPVGELPTAFERSQAEADRQADLLREGAKRAAEVAECEQRIVEMADTFANFQASRTMQEQASVALDEGWRQTLAGLGLPDGSAARVREWLTLRQLALDQLERQMAAKQAHGLLEDQIAEGKTKLLAALVDVGRTPTSNFHHLTELIALGAAADRDIVAANGAIQRRLSDINDLEREIEGGLAQETELTGRRLECRAKLDEKCQQLFLPDDASPQAIKAQLVEFQRWAQDYQLHVEHLNQVKQIRASEEAVLRAAKVLGQLLQEPNWDHFDTWLDGLTQRLVLSKEAASMKTTLERNEATEMLRRNRAMSDLEAAKQIFVSLLQLAGVQSVENLPDAESRADRRREVSMRLETLNSQLASTSDKDAGTLRKDLANLDSLAIDLEKQTCGAEIETLEADEMAAITSEQTSRAALVQVDTSDEAAHAREEMEVAIARYRSGVRPWAQLKLAEALLTEALRRHREKAQGPVVDLAGEYFKVMTGERFVSLWVDDDGAAPVLMARPGQGKPVGIDALSEGTADQLYLALRLAALQVQRQPDRMMPLVLDDVFMTSDDERAENIFRALEKFAAQGQVLVFTHHRHLVDIASRTVDTVGLKIHQLPAVFERSV